MLVHRALAEWQCCCVFGAPLFYRNGLDGLGLQKMRQMLIKGKDCGFA